MPSEHAFLSASAAHRWMHCTPSPTLELQYTEKPSAFANEGTQAHALAEAKLKDWLATGKRSEFACDDPSMNEYTDNYRDYCIEVYNEELAKYPEAKMKIEERLNFSEAVPKGFGTGDCVIISSDTAHVIDFKYGKGVLVDAEDNPQLKLYALGLVYGFYWYDGFEKIRLHVYQPRMSNISSWEISTADLVQWAEKEVKPLAQLAIKGEGEPKAGDWCQFCKAKGGCKARAEQLEAQIEAEMHPTGQLTEEDLSRILGKTEEWAKWIKAVEEFALDQALKGVKIPQWKIVEGRSNRKIKDEVGLTGALIKDGYSNIWTEPKLKSMTDLGKIVGKAAFDKLAAPYMYKPQGKPTLAPETDKRPPFNRAAADFEDIDEGE